MQDSTLLRIALITGTLGVVVLWILSGKIEIPEKHIHELNTDDTVRLQGVITGIMRNDRVTIMKLQVTDTLNVVVFDETGVQKGNHIEVTGNVQEYLGQDEVVADKIMVTSQ